MATNVNNLNNNSMSTTKVICSNCGAEVIIPNHEAQVSGIAIGKDSSLGTVILPTSGAQPCLHDAINVIASSLGVSSCEHTYSPFDALAALIAKIQEEGYVDVNKIVSRWIPSQCIAMINSHLGFHKSLKNRGLDYSWRVLLAELKRQMKMWKEGDMEGYRDRNRWYNKNIAVDMAFDYFERLRDAINEMPRHKHNGNLYVKVSCSLNNGKGIHLYELKSFLDNIQCKASKIRMAEDPEELYKFTSSFDELRSSIRLSVDMANAFMNAYKAAGGYYTMKDFIIFEGCKMKVDESGTPSRLQSGTYAEQEESLKALEKRAEQVVSSGVGHYGYQMLGLLKEFLKCNNVNYTDIKNKWARQSENRRRLRKLSGNRRPRK